jgi:hypothetical protein
MQERNETFFANKLAFTLEIEKKTQAVFAKDVGIAKSLVNLLVTGRQAPSRRLLRTIIEKATEDPFKQADLLAAHLMDEMQSAGSAKSWIQILVNAQGAARLGQPIATVDGK